MNIILTGPHGVGKTTLGERLARARGVPFHPEIGREMAEDPTWRAAGATAADAALAFDRELFTRELARDIAHPKTTRVVESWHPINLAYASRRSPEVVREWLGPLRACCAVMPAVVVELSAHRDTLAARQTEPGDLDFFIDVGRAAGRWALELGIPKLGVFYTDRDDPDALVEAIIEALGDER